MPTLISFGRCFAASASASGNVICSSATRWYVVVTMRKMRMTSSTSISGMKLISGSSRPRIPRRFMLLALLVREVDELDRLLLHLDHERVDLGAEVAVEDHRGDRDDEAHRRVVQRDGDALRELDGIGRRRALRAEDLDHADDRAEQAEQRRHGGDGAECREEALEVVRDHAPD